MESYGKKRFSDFRAAGFTLIELIVTMFILAIVAGFAKLYKWTNSGWK